MKNTALVLTLMLSLVGCAAIQQQPVNLSSNALSPNSGRIGVAMAALPPVDTHLPGAHCLLCMATAAIANSSLTSHAKTLQASEVASLKTEVADIVRKRNVDVLVIEEAINIDSFPDAGSTDANMAKKNFAQLREQYQLEKLIVIDITQLGFVRSYSGYFPISDPKGALIGSAYMVNLKTNQYEWYLPLNEVKSADQKWDEPTKFPGLTNAFFQAIEAGRDLVLRALER